jgi:hypothetical protein
MYLVFFYLALQSVILVDGIRLECEHSSREYQVILRPEIMSGANSFAQGVTAVIDELAAIEKAGVINFNISRSSLKITNVTVVKYQALIPNDLLLTIQLKSRKKKLDQPADFVFKVSNADPILACVPLSVANAYANFTEVKFELDFYATNGKAMSKSAMSYKITPEVDTFSSFARVNTTLLLTNAGKTLTYSGNDIIAVPNVYEVQFTAEFDVRLANKKHEATIFLLKNDGELQCEFSVRIKGNDVNPDSLIVAEQVINLISLVQSIAQPPIGLSSNSVSFFSFSSFLLKCFFLIIVFS